MKKAATRVRVKGQGGSPRAHPLRERPLSHPNRLNLRPGRNGLVFNPCAVPDHRRLGEDGAEDGGGAKEGEGAEAHSAKPRLMVEIGWGEVQ